MSAQKSLDKLKNKVSYFEQKIEDYRQLFLSDGVISDKEQKQLDVLDNKLQVIKLDIEEREGKQITNDNRPPEFQIKTPAPATMTASGNEKEDAPGLPKALLDLIANTIEGKEDRERVISVIESIYASNIVGSTDKDKKKVAGQAIINVLKRDKEKFSQAAFHQEFSKLYGKIKKSGTTIKVDNPMPAITFPSQTVFNNEFKNGGTLTGVISFNVNAKNGPLLSVENTSIPDTKITGEVFKNSIDPIRGELSSSLLNGGITAKGIKGYDWLSLSISTTAAGYSTKLADKDDFSLKIFGISGSIKGTIPPELIRKTLLTIPFYQELASFTQLDIDKWIKVSISATFTYNLVISKDDIKHLKKMNKLGDQFVDEVKKMEPLKQDLEEKVKEQADAKKGVKEAKSNKAKKRAEKQLEKVTNKVESRKARVEKQTDKLKKIGSKIDDVAAKLSKGAKPLGKILKKQIAKRAFSIASKFIPGLNVITTIMDIYDVAVIFGPIIIKGAQALYNEFTKEEEPEEDNKIYGGVDVQYILGSAKINENSQTITVDLIMTFGVDVHERTVIFDIERKENETYYLLSQQAVSLTMEDGQIYKMVKGSKAQYSNKDNGDSWRRY